MLRKKGLQLLRIKAHSNRVLIRVDTMDFLGDKEE